jgi:hypothetical protein
MPTTGDTAGTGRPPSAEYRAGAPCVGQALTHQNCRASWLCIRTNTHLRVPQRRQAQVSAITVVVAMSISFVVGVIGAVIRVSAPPR